MSIAQLGEKRPEDEHERDATCGKAAPERSASAPQAGRLLAQARTFVVLPLFGVLVPLMLLFQAYAAMGQLNSTLLGGPESRKYMETWVPQRVREPSTPLEYSLFTVIFLETGNREMMLNKQRMKMAAMNIGFAIASVGIMLLAFGISDGGIEVSGRSASGIGVDFRTASTGVAVFTLGAAIAAAGAIIPNRYTTVGLPKYEVRSSGASTEPVEQKRWLTKAETDELVGNLEQCLRDSPTDEGRRVCVVRSALEPFQGRK